MVSLGYVLYEWLAMVRGIEIGIVSPLELVRGRGFRRMSAWADLNESLRKSFKFPRGC